jgi:hypothetical protein
LAPTNFTRLLKAALTPVVVTSAAVTSAAALVACGNGAGGDGIAGKTIRYQVEYFGSPQTGQAHRAVTISYTSHEGRQEKHLIALPWTTVVGTAHSGFTPAVKAQFYGFGTIICRILADDELIQQEMSAEEPYPTVECQA